MRTLTYLFLLLASLSMTAQQAEQMKTYKKTPLTEEQEKRWSHLDLEKDSIPGMSVDKAYTELLNYKKGNKVIVGVIDSGVDISHADLKAVIWTNKKEIPKNGKDDDKNGYRDDVNDWNFLGDSNNETLELVRYLRKGDDGSESKDVLIILATGNDGKNVDVEPNYPEDTADKKTELVNNVVKVGAINYNYGEKVVADFSNYGTDNVDVFAPGVRIYATVEDHNFKYQQGTSMASPNVAGVAALIRSYYPNLKAAQVKQIIMQSGIPIDSEVYVGENGEKRPFSKTSVSGKMVNAYNALKLAEELSKEPKL